jgi:hypothetical protein
MKTLAKHGLLAAMFLSLALPGCGDKAGDGKDGKDGKDGGAAIDQSSPEKVAESFKAAVKAKDWKAVFACMTKESHKHLLGGLMVGAGFTAAFGDKKKKESFEALMKKHGVDMSKKLGPDDDPTAGIKDKPAMFGDLVEWLDKNSSQKKGEKQKSFSEQISSIELTNFKIDGDTATADATQDGKKKGEPTEFKKIDGKWYMHFEEKKSRPKRFPKD